jgi:hypothetical protein
MEPVRLVGQDFFPLDEELALLPGSRLTPRQQEHLVHLASWMPFEQAGKMLTCLLGVQVSESTVRRQTEATGALAEAVQTAEAQREGKGVPQGPGEARLAVSADGAYVPLLGGQWAEVRTVAIGEVMQEDTGAQEQEVQVGHLSYFSRMTDAEHFADLAGGEMQRRGVSRATAVCAVTDGAEWLQGFLDLHCPEAVRILDFPHAAEHLSALLDALQQAGVSLPSNPLERWLHVLKHRGPHWLLRWCQRLPAPFAENEAVQEQRCYLSKREALMQYPSYRASGWPIGSGMVECANKLVMQTRLKGPGMHWAPRHVNPMLALRTAVCNERWEETWAAVLCEQRRRLDLRRRQPATVRLHTLVSSFVLLLWRLRPPTPKPVPLPVPQAPPATLPGSSRPSPHHPWKRPFMLSPKRFAKI